MKERKDKDLGSIFNAKSLLDGQGTPQRDTAQSRKVALDFAGMLAKDGTSEGAKKGWETRRGAAALSEGPKEFRDFMVGAIAQRDTPDAKATKEMAENLKDSDVPLKDAFTAAQKRVDQADALAGETLKRFGSALSQYHVDNINRERETIKRAMDVADRHVRENSRGYAADAISNAVEGADLMSIWASSAVGEVWKKQTRERGVGKSGTSEGVPKTLKGSFLTEGDTQ